MTKPKKVEEPTAAYQPKPTTEPAKRNTTPPITDERAKAIAARLLEQRKQLLHKLAQ